MTMKITSFLFVLLISVFFQLADCRRSTNLQQAIQSIEKDSHYRSSSKKNRNWGLPSSTKQQEKTEAEKDNEIDVVMKSSSSMSCVNNTTTNEEETEEEAISVSRQNNNNNNEKKKKSSTDYHHYHPHEPAGRFERSLFSRW